MFTGIVECLGSVQRIDAGSLVLESTVVLGPDPVKIGESIAVNGCCLTVTEAREQDGHSQLGFDLSPETLARTSLGDLGQGSFVNLERAMRADGRFGGHVVQGHVDATGEVVSVTPNENSSVIRFRVPAGSERYLIDKGSITIDGISLTVVSPEGPEFDTWIIPHTIENTNLKERKAGDRVNLEFDVLAKYVERLLPSAKL
jgi:riboflavin synthase